MRVPAELRPNTQPFTADKESFREYFNLCTASAKLTQTLRTDALAHAQRFCNIGKGLMQRSTLVHATGKKKKVTSLRREKAFYSFRRLVSDWLEGESCGREEREGR